MELSPPLFFSLTGDKGPETSMFHKHIAQKIANKPEEKYEKFQTLIRCKLTTLNHCFNLEVSIRNSESISISKSKLLSFIRPAQNNICNIFDPKG